MIRTFPRDETRAVYHNRLVDRRLATDPFECLGKMKKGTMEYLNVVQVQTRKRDRV